ncbi:MAG: DUF5009 domain-containing protein [Deferribacteres bacterium]|nr:DUF5009 domain-containing protein [candidate division KSB1 bacterium]MCB9502111.1 DUF5009 domain-containing protein [Deferribacteres bacterium]
MSNQRLLSLDALRGLTIALMIVVNNPGSWSFVYAPLRHAEWHGCTPTDLVFPFFLFIVGSAMAFSFSKFDSETSSKTSLLKKVISRSIKLILLGWILSLFPEFKFNSMRFFGVLPRIGICYFFASLIVIYHNRTGQVVWTLILLAGYWILMTTVPFPGRGADSWVFGTNLAQFFDKLILGSHMWKSDLEPEGIISTLPAIAQVLLGFFTGKMLQTTKAHQEKVNILFIYGAFAIFLALILEPVMPINKQLWTSSYVFYTAGIGLMVLAICYWFVEIKGLQKMMQPFIEFGSNAIIVFFGSGIVAKILWKVKLGHGDEAISLKQWFYQEILHPVLGDYNASLAFAILFVTLWFLVAHWLYKKNIFIKV